MKYLDNKRLGKQRLEAVQILSICRYLSLLAKRYSIPFPSCRYQLPEFISQISSKYKSEGIRFVFRNRKWESVDLKTRFHKLGVDEIVVERGEKIRIYNLNSKKTIEVLPYYFLDRDEFIISLGFCFHPAVLLWIGYEDALAEYINASIDEFVSRGFRNRFPKFDLSEVEIKYPQWIFDSDFHARHRARLLDKNREEYLPKFANKKIGENSYFWPWTGEKTKFGVADISRRYSS
jgi:hypothetical protein